ncbi:MAG TPA: long-chain fatty acid--CoA ligase [Vicinamibacterales bacterium]|nr:long-chain fatty acid--CoA ligase [Vicinamibacterales bacterium]
MLNLSAVLEQHARRRPEGEAIVFGDKRMSYGQLNAWSNQIANGLAASGIRRGDHVALLCPNLPYFPAAYFGILKAGATVVPLNVLLKPREIAYHLRDSDAKAMFCFQGTPELPMAEAARAAVAVVPSCRQLIVLPAPSNVEKAMDPDADTIVLDQFIGGQPATFDTCDTEPNDTAVILYTSGTTGQPKGAELTHLNMVMNGMVSAELCAGSSDESGRHATAITLPLFHATAQTAQMLAYLHLGGTLVLLPRFDPAALLATMARERVTHWIGVPTMYWAVLKYAREQQIDVTNAAATLRLVVSGGAPMPVELMKDFETTFGVRIIEGYGLSETAPVASFNHLDRPSKPGTVGQPLFAVEIMIVDDKDEQVETGTAGEIVIRGHNVMKGYYKQPEATANALRNGWFHTGDIGTFDADGYLSIVDRKKDMILRGGYNVYPREIEEVMLAHHAVSLVAVIGVPDERLGEEVKAFVVKKPGVEVTEDELRFWCKEQLAAYKYPRHIEFRENLPTSATGKILKRDLRVQ